MNRKLKNDIENYCKLNNIKEVNRFIDKLVTIGFNHIKYGSKPYDEGNVESSSEAKEEINNSTITKKIKIIRNDSNKEKN